MVIQTEQPKPKKISRLKISESRVLPKVKVQRPVGGKLRFETKWDKFKRLWGN